MVRIASSSLALPADTRLDRRLDSRPLALLRPLRSPPNNPPPPLRRRDERHEGLRRDGVDYRADGEVDRLAGGLYAGCCWGGTVVV